MTRLVIIPFFTIPKPTNLIFRWGGKWWKKAGGSYYAVSVPTKGESVEGRLFGVYENIVIFKKDLPSHLKGNIIDELDA